MEFQCHLLEDFRPAPRDGDGVCPVKGCSEGGPLPTRETRGKEQLKGM